METVAEMRTMCKLKYNVNYNLCKLKYDEIIQILYFIRLLTCTHMHIHTHKHRGKQSNYKCEN